MAVCVCRHHLGVIYPTATGHEWSCAIQQNWAADNGATAPPERKSGQKVGALLNQELFAVAEQIELIAGDIGAYEQDLKRARERHAGLLMRYHALKIAEAHFLEEQQHERTERGVEE